MNRLPDEVQAKIEADSKATLDSYFEDLKQREIQRVIEEIDFQHQQALEDLKRWLRGENGSDGSPQRPPLHQEAPSPSQEKTAKRNGSHRTPNRREMLLMVLPDLNGATFYRRDVEAKIIERWPWAEPTTKVEKKNFSSRIAGLLTDLTSKGRLEAIEGERRFDPTVYRVIDNDEDTLLKSEP